MDAVLDYEPRAGRTATPHRRRRDGLPRLRPRRAHAGCGFPARQRLQRPRLSDDPRAAGRRLAHPCAGPARPWRHAPAHRSSARLLARPEGRPAGLPGGHGAGAGGAGWPLDGRHRLAAGLGRGAGEGAGAGAVRPGDPPAGSAGLPPSADLIGVSPMVQGALKRRRAFASRQAAVDGYRGRGAFRTWTEAQLEDYVAGGFHDTLDGTVTLACTPEWEVSNYVNQATTPGPPSPPRAARSASCAPGSIRPAGSMKASTALPPPAASRSTPSLTRPTSCRWSAPIWSAKRSSKPCVSPEAHHLRRRAPIRAPIAAQTAIPSVYQASTKAAVLSWQ